MKEELKTPGSKTFIPSEAIMASSGFNTRGCHDLGMATATAMALTLGMLFAPTTHGQTPLVDLSTITVKDLGKVAAMPNKDPRNLQPIAPLAAKPGGGAYIQWATQQGWNGGDRFKASSKVYVTEVDSNGTVTGSDIDLGTSHPGGIVATNDGFGYYLFDGGKLSFDRYANGQQVGKLLMMDHTDGEGRPTEFRRGIDLRSNGEFVFGWAVPYAPFSRGHGGLTFGNGLIGTTFATWNNYQPSGNPPSSGWTNPDDAHTGSTAWFFGDNPTQNYLMSYSTGDHSMDQRMVFDDGQFYSVSLNPHIAFRRFDGQGNAIETTFLFNQLVNYTDANGKSTTDIGGSEIKGSDGKWQVKTEFLEASGYTTGKLGDLHALGNNRFALTYGSYPWSNGSNYRAGKNQVDIAILDGDGNVITRKVVAKPETREGQGKYTKYIPYEQVEWVKSAMVGNNIMVVWATRRADSKEQPIYMAVVDKNGDIVQAQQSIPASTARFNYSDRIHNLSNGKLAWTYTGGGKLQLYMMGTGTGITPTPEAFKAALQGARSSKCVDVPARNTADNVGIIQWTCNGGPNQKMTFKPVTGKVDVYTLVFDHSNKCLHVPGTANGTDLVQNTCDNSTSQQFKLESVGDNLYKLTAQNSGKGLDVENYSTADNGKIQQWDFVGGQNQKWRVVRDL